MVCFADFRQILSMAVFGPGPRTTYGPVHRLPLRTLSTDHPQNRIKIRNKYFTYGLYNRLLVLAKFRVLHCANVLTPSPRPPAPPQKPKSCFQRKEMPMAKTRKIVIFYSWLNLAMEDVFLGRSSMFVSVIALSKS